MTKKIPGTYAELQDRVLLTSIFGEWSDLGNHKQYRRRRGHPKLVGDYKRVYFKGQHLAASRFEAALASLIGADRATTAAEVPSLKHWRRVKEENAALTKRLGELMSENTKLKKGVELLILAPTCFGRPGPRRYAGVR